MLYNPEYLLLSKIADNPSPAATAEAEGQTLETVLKRLRALDSEVPSTLFSVFTNDEVLLSPVGKAYADAASKIRKIAVDAELKAEKASRERAATLVAASLDNKVDKAFRAAGVKAKAVFFDTTRKDASKDLRRLGKDYDVVVGMYDGQMLKRLRLEAMQLSNMAIGAAFNSGNPLAKRKRLDIEDLYGKTTYAPREGFSRKFDILVSDMRDFHPKAEIERVDAYTPALFEQVASEGSFILMPPRADLSAYGLKTVPVEWSYRIQYGIIHLPNPEGKVKDLLDSLEAIKAKEGKG